MVDKRSDNNISNTNVPDSLSQKESTHNKTPNLIEKGKQWILQVRQRKNALEKKTFQETQVNLSGLETNIIEGEKQAVTQHTEYMTSTALDTLKQPIKQHISSKHKSYPNLPPLIQTEIEKNSESHNPHKGLIDTNRKKSYLAVENTIEDITKNDRSLIGRLTKKLSV